MLEKMPAVNKVNKYYREMEKLGSLDYMTAFKKITDMYFYIINMSKDSDDSLFTSYIDGQLYEIEQALPLKYIVDFKTKFSEMDDSEFEHDYQEKIIKKATYEEDVLDFIVSTARNRLFLSTKDINDPNKYDSIILDNRCIEAATYVADICDVLKIKNKIYRIDPGFSQDLQLYYGNGYHFFNYITFEDKDYIIDCSYSQFFKMNQNNPLALNIDMDGCLPGIYMIQTASRLQTAKNILEYGWIKATDKSIKDYFDGFAMSYRNGLYYKDMNPVEYRTNYTAEDYMSFLKTTDNQSKREDVSYLGIPGELPLKYDIDFTDNTRFFEREEDNKKALRIIKKYKKV